MRSAPLLPARPAARLSAAPVLARLLATALALAAATARADAAFPTLPASGADAGAARDSGAAALAGDDAPAPGSAAVVADSRAAVTAGSAFNPQVSLILTGHYRHDNAGGAGAEALEEAAGILHGVHFDGHGHGQGSGNGFALGESELVLSATVDPYFDARFIAAFDGHEAEVEEAWLQTRMLPQGLRLTAGKFLSGIGYQNAQHPHAWDFDDQALPYTALLGDHGLNDAGVQLTWLAPAPFYLLLGAEALQGNEQERFGALVAEEDGLTVLTPAAGGFPAPTSGPRLLTAFAKAAPDLGDDHALQLGVSVARARQAQQLVDEDDSVAGDEFLLDGTQTLYGADLVYKFDGRGGQGAGDVKVAAEYLRLETDLEVAADAGAAPLATGARVQGVQDGWYLAATWGVAPRWSLGLRLDASGGTNRLRAAGATTGLADTTRATLALAWKPSEFSRLRLQGSRADVGAEDGSRRDLDTVLLTYTLSLGAHGAHAF